MTERQRQLRLVLFLIFSAGIIGVVLSCQQSHRPAVARSSATEPTTMTAAAAAADAPMEGVSYGEVKGKAIDVAFARSWGFSYPPAPKSRAKEKAQAGSESCISCHSGTDAHSMHPDASGVVISCVDCHGGNGSVVRNAGETDQSFQKRAHVQPKHPELWQDPHNPTRISSANPQLLGAQENIESADYVRFVNPGDFRAAWMSCYACHADETEKNNHSMMAHGAMLWEAALYNNGVVNRKNPIYGQAYMPDGTPAKIAVTPPPTTQQTHDRGWLSALWPLPRWEITQPGNILRVFERGGKSRPVIGIPDPMEDAGRPEVKLSIREYGTDVRTDPVFLGLQKTRLLDPTLTFFGTNDHPGDYRASGCSACHVVYANDRSPIHSALWATAGNQGMSQSADQQIPHNESGHPIKHVFVQNMPSSTCISCHIHPGTNVVNSYLGYMWWDNESDGKFMYPNYQRKITSDDELAVNDHNPEGSAPKGLWSDNPKYANDQNAYGVKQGTDFLDRLYDLNSNPNLKHSVFADFHGHGWVFRAVFKKDRHGNLLDKDGNVVVNPTRQQMLDAVAYDGSKPKPANVPVHLKDIHLEKGMQCVDCHFQTDGHGDGHLYGETRAAVMETCIDCHGTADKVANVMAYLQERDNPDRDDAKLDGLLRTAFTNNTAKNPDDDTLNLWKSMLAKRGKRTKFEVRDGKLFQKSALYAENPDAAKKAGVPEGWFVVQTADTSTADSWWAKDDNAHGKASPTHARYAHTVQRVADGNGKLKWGSALPADHPDLAHGANVSCYACHTSWNTSCFGCHLPQRANWRKRTLHNEAVNTRNYINYNYETLRDDLYMLGMDSTVKQVEKGGKSYHQVVPVRSACAVVVSSEDAERQWIYAQQQTVSAEGFAGTAFSPYFPHTVRASETRNCVDCHISKDGNNNAVMAQLLMQGTNAYNFVGRFAWVAEGNHGLEAVAVTERDEPQAVIGSTLHEIAYPDNYRDHVSRGQKLKESYEHTGTVRDVQARGEYLYAACGSDGFIAYDIANVDNKGFSERITLAPVSPVGQKFYVRSKDATSICSPSTLALDPTRPQRPENDEQKVALLYAFLYMTDSQEGLIVIGNTKDGPNKLGVATLLDGNPDNNFLSRALTYNPDGLLKGARSMTLYGTYAYISCDAGLVVVDLVDPLHPKYVTTVAGLNHPRKVEFQFRYGWAIDADGVKVIDVTTPTQPKVVSGALVPVAHAHDIYISRTYAYVAAGSEGLLILDVERPEQPKPYLVVNRDEHGEVIVGDARSVRIGFTNASMFAYVADGRYGLKVLQLTSPEFSPTYIGYSPELTPKLVAEYETEGEAVALSKGVDRDRAVDESGNQLSVFGRRGARPFTLEEQQRLYFRDDGKGGKTLFTVGNDPDNDPIAPATKPAPAGGTPAKPKPAGGGGDTDLPGL